MRTEWIWIAVFVGVIVLTFLILRAQRANLSQPADEVRRSEEGARDLRERIDRDDKQA